LRNWQIVVMGVVLVLVILAFSGPLEKAVEQALAGRGRFRISRHTGRVRL
jgi:hypothetical protein